MENIKKKVLFMGVEIPDGCSAGDVLRAMANGFDNKIYGNSTYENSAIGIDYVVETGLNKGIKKIPFDYDFQIEMEEKVSLVTVMNWGKENGN